MAQFEPICLAQTRPITLAQNEPKYSPKEVIIEDKTINEKLRLISQLDEEDKNMVFRMIDKMLTTKKFKEFFDKNMASL